MIATTLSIIGGALAVVAGVVAVFVAWRDRRDDRRAESVEAAVRRRLIGDAYWFSEDPPTMNLILGLAQGRDVATLRDEWRRALAEKEEADAR